MSSLPFPATSEEYEEYVAMMEAMADEAEASTPDPLPHHFGLDHDRLMHDSLSDEAENSNL